jgi:hypothetical protein
MNDLNSYSAIRYELRADEYEPWKTFADGIQASQSWRSEWFGVARRFFLYGGAKEFNPTWDDVDRIVDYATALEAAVVPEHEFSSRRFRHRAAMLVSRRTPREQKVVCKFVRQVYDLRSSIVHDNKLSKDQRNWLIENCRNLELPVRQVLTAAVQNVPAEEADRRTMLAALYDPTDENRGDFALQKFQEIRTDPVKKAIAEKIAKLVGT